MSINRRKFISSMAAAGATIVGGPAVALMREKPYDIVFRDQTLELSRPIVIEEGLSALFENCVIQKGYDFTEDCAALISKRYSSVTLINVVFRRKPAPIPVPFASRGVVPFEVSLLTQGIGPHRR